MNVKKIFKPDYLFCLLAIPMLMFAFSRMWGFAVSVAGINPGSAVMYAGVAAAEFVVILFRKKIKEYIVSDLSGIGIKTAVGAFAVAFACSFGAEQVVLRGSINGGNTFCVLGGALFLAVFFMYLIKNCRHLHKRIQALSVHKTDLIFAVAVLMLLNAEAFVFCKFLKVIFVWDNAGYFTTVHSLNDIFPKLSYFKAVYQSIFETDYNYVIMLPASIMCKLFGKSRLVFVLSIVNFYLFPLFMMIYFAGKRYFRLSCFKIICVFLALPYLIFAANTGFIDVGGIIPVFAVLILYFYSDRNKYSVLIGVLLALAVYMRRWYSFFALSFVITVFIHSCTKKNFKAFLEILVSFGFVLIFFTQDFVSEKLMADYKYMYSAYALGVRTDVMIFTRYFGVIMTAVAGLYVIIMQIAKRKHIRGESYILLQGIIMFALFVSVQTHGQQHLSLYIPAFALLIMYVVSNLKKGVLSTLMICLCIFQMANTFIPRVQPTSIQGIKYPAPVPDFSNYPKVDKNAETILPVTEYMDREIGKNGKTVCFLASSLKLNYETLKNAEVSLSVEQKTDVDRHSYYYSISDVDKRDGLSDALFETDYILVPSELQIHLAPEEQKVISVPYEMLLNKEGFGAAYEKQDAEFKLADGTVIYLYQRTRPVEAEEIEAVRSKIFG